MSLYAYNKTTSALVLAAGGKTLPASTAVGVRSKPFDVSGEFKTLTSGQFASLQAQVAAGSCEYEWTGLPEFNTYTLVAGSASADFGELDEIIYVSTTGNDANPGTSALPLLTMKAAFAKVPAVWKKSMVIQFGLGTFPPNGMPLVRIGAPNGPGASPLQILGTAADQIGPQVAAGGSTSKSYICAVDPVVADDLLTGAFINNAGSRALITGNVTVLGVCTISVIGDGISVTAGDAFVVERPGTVFEVGPFEVLDIGHPAGEVGFGMRDIKIADAGGGPSFVPLAVLPGFNFFEAIEFDQGSGRQVFGFHGTRWNMASEQVYWNSAPVNPFSGSYQAGLYAHSTSSLSPGFIGLSDRCSWDAALVLRNTGLYVNTNSSASFFAIDAKNYAIFFDNLVSANIQQGALDTDLGYGAGGIQAADYILLQLGGNPNGLEVKNSVGNGVSMSGKSELLAENVSGAANGGHGLECKNGSLLRIGEFGGSTTLTGALGDVLVGAVTKAYAALPYGEVNGSGPTGNRAQ